MKIRLLVILLCLILVSCKSNAQIKDQWIDKNEDENYTARHECSFVQAGDKFIMFGGRESAPKLDIYDFQSNSWTTAKNKAPKEFNHFQATFYKGFIWVIGSFKTNNFPRELPEENVWLYYPVNDVWIKGPEIPEKRRRGGAGLVIYKDKFYLVGGNTIGHDGGYVNWFDEYDPVNNTWKILENASQARDHFSAAVIGNKLYAVAGRHSGGEGGVFGPLVSVVDVYNFNTKTWSVLKNNIPTPRAAPGVAVFNNELLVMGGEGEEKGPAYKIVEAYNPKTNKWTNKASMHYPRHGTQAILSGEGIYIAAGSPKRGGGRQLNMEVYNVDNPNGTPLTASYLTAPEKVQISKGSSIEIKVKNEGGNTGSFITSVQIAGVDANAFKIESNHNHTLIDSNIEFRIKVSHLTKVIGETADLEINYNGNAKKIINLVSH
ncbi:Kelch repeat-containing protein [Seonamhaeicola aphaedonensis]|uniref:N-acetylneuraminic acid mutarotase n=1 Tax=Seonamhaeicola aphaedonensis TaxID=1461338 RepID=A0A3D9HLQ0_9FLAO|nr:kelch repeat-containing protein [Seonamhaeicola aphaedonensis]RED50403.1 N-acetylneuraminic acid mutarotase [Seonamhaeicola aphaedonensis]